MSSDTWIALSCLGKSVENGKELFVLGGVGGSAAYLKSLFLLILCLCFLLLHVVYHFQFLGSWGLFFKGTVSTDSFHENNQPPTEQRWYSGMKRRIWAGHWKCCKPCECCHSNFADSRSSRPRYQDHWNGESHTSWQNLTYKLHIII